MNSTLQIRLEVSPQQAARLRALQIAFAEVCNALAPVVRRTRCWNRVALHHMTYRSLRERFPQLGSQMICNAIYSVSRTSRLVYQHPSSPFNVARLGQRALPLIRFGENCPVYFDRHTLSVKQGRLSLYSLDGRMRFGVGLKPADERHLQEGKLRETVLQRRSDGVFELCFWVAFAQPGAGGGEEPAETDGSPAAIPDYVLVEEAA